MAYLTPQVCPCCGFRTLDRVDSDEICVICWWQDDGQGDSDAEEVRGGPNGHYSLAMARMNFRAHGHMYAVGKGIDIVENPTPARRRLVDYVLSVVTDSTLMNRAKLDRLLADAVDREV